MANKAVGNPVVENRWEIFPCNGMWIYSEKPLFYMMYTSKIISKK
jgi:hypothetical protein